MPLFVDKNTTSSKENPPAKRFVPEIASVLIYGEYKLVKLGSWG